MKKAILFIASTASILSFAAPRATSTADLFNCQGEKGTTVSYSTTSFVGRPELSIKFQGEEVKATGLTSQPSPMGTLVTVTDNHMVPVDGPSLRYTLVVPQVVLANNTAQATFKTSLVRTSLANRLFGPATYSGPIENNQVETLTCQASFVVF